MLTHIETQLVLLKGLSEQEEEICAQLTAKVTPLYFRRITRKFYKDQESFFKALDVTYKNLS